MPGLRRIGRVGLNAGLLVLAAGYLVAGGSAAAAGDWWLAREPWIDIGLTLIVAGLVATAVFELVRVVVEPIGWLRLGALPPGLFVGAIWALTIVFEVPTSSGAFGVQQFDIRTTFYSSPETLAATTVGTLLIGLPLLIARLRPAAGRVGADPSGTSGVVR